MKDIILYVQFLPKEISSNAHNLNNIYIKHNYYIYKTQLLYIKYI